MSYAKAIAAEKQKLARQKEAVNTTENLIAALERMEAEAKPKEAKK